MEQAALKSILLFSVIFLVITFITINIKNKQILDIIKILHCLFYCAIILISMSGLGLID